MFDWFNRKKDVKELKEETKKSFDLVKKDISAIGEWIKHLDSERNNQEKEIMEIKEILSSINLEIEGLKNVLSVMNELKPKQLFKTPKQVFRKQTGVYAVQTGVQTGVQTPNLDNFSLTEKAILWVLLNSEMKLSYEDLAAVLGKEKSTIRGQINKLKSSNKELIEEVMESNGKKRVFIPENVKEKLLKKSKVKIKDSKVEKTHVQGSKKLKSGG